MPAADPIADLVGSLERAVVASGRRRRDVVREIEGDLREAVAARIAAGVPERSAASAVVAEFGDPAPIAAELSRELLADVGRRYSPASAGIVAVLFQNRQYPGDILGSVILECGWNHQLSSLQANVLAGSKQCIREYAAASFNQ